MSNNPQYRFPKSSKLTNKRLIDKVFSEGNVDFAYPFRVVSLPYSKDNESVDNECDNIDRVHVFVSVSKKLHKRAVKRNKIRRRCKEAFRLNINKLDYTLKEDLNIAFIYISKEEINYKTIEHGMAKCIEKLTQRYSSCNYCHPTDSDMDI